MHLVITLAIVVRDKDLDSGLKIVFLRPTAGWKSYSAQICLARIIFNISPKTSIIFSKYADYRHNLGPIGALLVINYP